MSKTEEAQKFERYCNQLEKYGKTESLHSPTLTMLRKKASKQLVLMMKSEEDCSSRISKLWMLGYYCPYQYFLIDKENAMETTTLLTMFSGELHEILPYSNQKYSALWNLFIGDLHRYMPDGEVQKPLAEVFYTRCIELDSRHGRAYHVLSTVKDSISVAQRLRLMILAQLAEIPHKKNAELFGFLNSSEDDVSLTSSEKLLIDFISWALKDNGHKGDYQQLGVELQRRFKKLIDEKSDTDWPMIMSACQLSARLAMKTGFRQFLNCFDVISTTYLTLASGTMTNRLLFDAMTWIQTVGEVFQSEDPIKKEPHFHSLTVFAKTKWNELNDVLTDHMNRVFLSKPTELNEVPRSDSVQLLINGPILEPSKEMLSHLLLRIVSLQNPTIEFNEEREQRDPLLRRINQTEHKPLGVPIEALTEKLSQSDREDWRPVYVLMDFDTMLNKFRIACKVWEIDDFICILPSNVLDLLDHQKTKIKSVRPVIRTLMELQAEGKMILRKCIDERDCASQLVRSAGGSGNDHRNIVAYLCKNPEEQSPMEGVTFYEIRQFHKKYLE